MLYRADVLHRASAWDETKESVKVVYNNYQKGIAVRRFYRGVKEVAALAEFKWP